MESPGMWGDRRDQTRKLGCKRMCWFCLSIVCSHSGNIPLIALQELPLSHSALPGWVMLTLSPGSRRERDAYPSEVSQSTLHPPRFPNQSEMSKQLKLGQSPSTELGFLLKQMDRSSSFAFLSHWASKDWMALPTLVKANLFTGKNVSNLFLKHPPRCTHN